MKKIKIIIKKEDLINIRKPIPKPDFSFKDQSKYNKKKNIKKILNMNNFFKLLYRNN